MSITLPADTRLPHQIRREAEQAHMLLEHVGLPRDPDCGRCTLGLDPLSIGLPDDPFEIDAQRQWLTAANRERVALAAALMADIEAFEAMVAW